MGAGILIIEDEAVLARNMRTSLLRCGHDVRTAGSAEEGLRQVPLFMPRLAIVDYRLPGMDGLQLVARLKRIDPSIAVIMLSGHHDAILAGNALRIGAHACLAKPVSLEELRRTVTTALAAAGDGPRTASPLGPGVQPLAASQ